MGDLAENLGLADVHDRLVDHPRVHAWPLGRDVLDVESAEGPEPAWVRMDNPEGASDDLAPGEPALGQVIDPGHLEDIGMAEQARSGYPAG